MRSYRCFSRVLDVGYGEIDAFCTGRKKNREEEKVLFPEFITDAYKKWLVICFLCQIEWQLEIKRLERLGSSWGEIFFGKRCFWGEMFLGGDIWKMSMYFVNSRKEVRISLAKLSNTKFDLLCWSDAIAILHCTSPCYSPDLLIHTYTHIYILLIETSYYQSQTPSSLLPLPSLSSPPLPFLPISTCDSIQLIDNLIP